MTYRRTPVEGVTLTIRFSDETSLKEFVADVFDDSRAAFPADGLDPEFNGRAPKGAFVLRSADTDRIT